MVKLCNKNLDYNIVAEKLYIFEIFREFFLGGVYQIRKFTAILTIKRQFVERYKI